jgi:hypothetical protein
MNRCITDEHIEAYNSGPLKTLFEGIKEDPELSLEIRRNNEVMVYYHKDKILTSKVDSHGNPRIKILDKKYYKEKPKPSIDLSDINNLKSLTLIRRYFSEAKKLVYVYKIGAEFTVQQNIALGNQSFDNRYLVVDMEWQFSQSEISKKERISKTRIDLVVIDTQPNNDGENDIYLAELKVGTGAKDGNSGIISHVDKTYEIISQKEACKALLEDVTSIVDQKKSLGLIEGTHKDFNFASKPKMMLILAYRGNIEKEKLSKEGEKAKEQAKKIGMEEPLCIMYNALITLK